MISKEEMKELGLDCSHFNTKEKTIPECESNGHYLCEQCMNYTGDVFERLREDWELWEKEIYENLLYETAQVLIKKSWHCNNPDCNRPTNELYRCNCCLTKVCRDCFVLTDQCHWCKKCVEWYNKKYGGKT